MSATLSSPSVTWYLMAEGARTELGVRQDEARVPEGCPQEFQRRDLCEVYSRGRLGHAFTQGINLGDILAHL